MADQRDTTTGYSTTGDSSSKGDDTLSTILQNERRPQFSTNSSTSPRNVSELSADQFEEGLARLLEVDFSEEIHFKGEMKIGEDAYKVTMTGEDWLSNAPFFRAGDYFAIDFRGIPRRDENFKELLDGYDKWIFLNEKEGAMGWRQYAYRDLEPPNTHSEMPYFFDGGGSLFQQKDDYLLPWVIQTILSMQQIQDQIQDQVFVDVGSRNGLVGLMALHMGAREVIFVENVPVYTEMASLHNRHLEMLRGEGNFQEIEEKDDLIVENLKANQLYGNPRVVVKHENIIDVSPDKRDGVVISFNFPRFGVPYYNSYIDESEVPEEYKNHSQEFLMEFYDRTERRDSLAADLLTIFPNANWIIASGGTTEDLKRDEDKAIRDFLRMPLFREYAASEFYAYQHRSSGGSLNQKTGKWTSYETQYPVYFHTFVLARHDQN